MTPDQFTKELLGAIGVMGAVISFLYFQSYGGMRESRDEWRDHAKSLERALDDLTKVAETNVAASQAIQKSEERTTEMVSDIWYEVVPTGNRRGRGGNAP